MSAKRKPIEVVTPEKLGVEVSPRLETLKVVEPPQSETGARVAHVEKLIAKLVNETKVI